MSASFRDMDERELGEALARIGREIAWPEPPPIATPVAAMIEARRRQPSLLTPRLSLPSRRRTVIVIAAAVLALAAAALATRLVFDLGAVTVRILPGRPSALPTNVATAEDLGREVGLAEAGRIAGFDPALPGSLGPPDRTWIDEATVDPEAGDRVVRIVNAWRPAPGLPPIEGTDDGAVLMQFQGEWEAAAKLLFAETNRFGEAIVDGRPAFWTRGPHELVLVTDGERRRVLVTGTVVIWQDAGFTFRLETSLPKARALAIAESVDPQVDLG
jgi:hypothetical protein